MKILLKNCLLYALLSGVFLFIHFLIICFMTLLFAVSLADLMQHLPQMLEVKYAIIILFGSLTFILTLYILDKSDKLDKYLKEKLNLDID